MSQRSDTISQIEPLDASLCTACHIALCASFERSNDSRIPGRYRTRSTTAAELNITARRGCPICAHVFTDIIVGHRPSSPQPSTRNVWVQFSTKNFQCDRIVASRFMQSVRPTIRLYLQVILLGLSADTLDTVLEFEPYTDFQRSLRNLIKPPSMPGSSSTSRLNELPLSEVECLELISRLARRWLRLCRKHHTRECEPWREVGWRPRRLLHVCRTDLGELQVKLQDDLHVKVTSYITTSHRWLSTKEYRLTQDRLSALRHSVPIHELKKSLRDALLICIKLDVEYLWVDSLCIIQDDPVDVQHQISAMHRIYGFAYCNLVAADVVNADRGLLDGHPRCYSSTYFVTIHPADSTASTWCMGIARETGRKSMAECVLATRGWVFQERFLAPRTLHLGQRELHWRCQCTTASETWPVPRSVDEATGENSDFEALLHQKRTIGAVRDPRNAMSFWFAVVEAYTRCELTFSSDRASAFQGILKHFQHRYYTDVLKGQLWVSTLPEALLWYRVPMAGRGRHMPGILPTWSWASMTGRIEYADILLSGGETIATLLPSTDLIPTDKDSIFMSGRPWQAVVGKTIFPERDGFKQTDWVPTAVTSYEAMIIPDDGWPVEATVCCLPICQGIHFDAVSMQSDYNVVIHGLLLHNVHHGNEPIYSRCGYFRYSWKSVYVQIGEDRVLRDIPMLPPQERVLEII